MALPDIKMIACGRRKPGLTKREYLDYHFQVHGQLSDRPSNKAEKPRKYIQVHITDAAFPERPGSHLPNTNYSWVGRDDITELTYHDIDHVKSVFGSSFVKENIGPDGINFNDFETAISLLTIEKVVKLPFRTDSGPPEEEAFVAHLWLARPSRSKEGTQLEQFATPHLVAAISDQAASEVYEIRANVGVTSDQFDLERYFGGGGTAPVYALVYKIFLRGSKSVAAVRRAQRAFETAVATAESEDSKQVEPTKTFITFGMSGLVLDTEKDIAFDSERIPKISTAF